MNYINQRYENKNVKIEFEIKTEIPMKSGWYLIIQQMSVLCEKLLNELQADYDIAKGNVSPAFTEAKDGIEFILHEDK